MAENKVTIKTKFKTLVTNVDAEKERVRFLMDEFFDHFNISENGKSTFRPVEGDESKMIIETIIDPDRYTLVKSLIEKCYPDLCVFDYEE